MSDYLNFSIQTRKDLANWCFRQLGAPLISIELRQEHIDDCINDAVEEYTEYAANEKKFFALNLKDYIRTVKAIICLEMYKQLVIYTIMVYMVLLQLV